MGVLRCQLEGRHQPSAVTFEVTSPVASSDGWRAEGGAALIDGSYVTFPAWADSGDVILHADGFGDVEVGWSALHEDGFTPCAPIEFVLQSGAVVGRVVSSAGDPLPALTVHACGRRTQTDDGGDYAILVEAGSVCDVQTCTSKRVACSAAEVEFMGLNDDGECWVFEDDVCASAVAAVERGTDTLVDLTIDAVD